ncbi:MAG TPA: ROK family protein [Tepidisphaeraceae bacterium]|jgi:predicted NBD/HSP70 family sugar kinase
MRALGIDIGGTSVKAAQLQDGQVAWTGRSPPFTRPDTAQLVEAIRQAVAARAPGPIDAVGVCCPGLLDRTVRTITLSVNVPGLVGVPLDDIVSRALGAGLPQACILSDANAVGYDIYVSRRLSGRLLCLTLGTGVGAAVVDHDAGRFLHVSGESPGHLGQLDVSLDADAPLGPDGGRGSLEAYIGSAALAARYGGANVIERLGVDEPPIRALVRAIRIGHAIYRPQHVCLTGGVGIRLAGIAGEIKAAVDQALTAVARKDWTLLTGQSDFHAACGVARWAAAAASATSP